MVAAPAFREIYSVAPTPFEKQTSYYQESQNVGSGYHIATAGIGAKNYCTAHLGLWQAEAPIKGREDSGYVGEVSTNSGTNVSRMLMPHRR